MKILQQSVCPKGEQKLCDKNIFDNQRKETLVGFGSQHIINDCHRKTGGHIYCLGMYQCYSLPYGDGRKVARRHTLYRQENGSSRNHH